MRLLHRMFVGSVMTLGHVKPSLCCLLHPFAVLTAFVRIPEDALSRTHAGVKSLITKPDADAWRFQYFGVDDR